MERSQYANRAVVEIRKIRTISYNATDYFYAWRSMKEGEARIENIVNT